MKPVLGLFLAWVEVDSACRREVAASLALDARLSRLPRQVSPMAEAPEDLPVVLPDGEWPGIEE